MTITEIDAYTAGKSYAELMTAIEQSDGAGRIYVDMSEVTYMDSNGITTLVRAKQHLDDDGRGLRIVTLSEPVRRVLEITGLLDHFLVEVPRAPSRPALARPIRRAFGEVNDLVARLNRI